MQLKNLINRTFVSAVFFAGIFLSSCKKENNTAKPPVSNTIKKVTTGDESLTFEYNADGNISKAAIKNNETTNGDIINYSVSYNAAKQISEITGDNHEKIIPVYENGVLVRSYLKTSEGEELGFTEYEDFNATTKAASLYSEIGGVIYPLAMQLFSYDATGNIEKTGFYLQNPLVSNALVFTGTATYSYDSKINPLTKAADFLKLLWITVPKNNVLSEIHKDKDGVLEETVEYTYQYSSNGKPVSGTIKRTPAGGAAEIKNIQFSY